MPTFVSARYVDGIHSWFGHMYSTVRVSMYVEVGIYSVDLSPEIQPKQFINAVNL